MPPTVFPGRSMVHCSMPPLSEWQTLLSVQASAAATLTGLVFVAVSINLAKIISIPGLPSRAAESIVQFLQVFFICTATLIPRQPITALAAEILAVSLFSWAAAGHGANPLRPVAFRPPASVADDPDCADPACQHSVFRGRDLPAAWVSRRPLLACAGIRLFLCRRRRQCLGAAGRGRPLVPTVFRLVIN